ncbi:beta strand repeat-containing protein [Massilia sp. S19_KUP03_FR1]|uniref:beta strand repeat-containing protein n=1 Tax=Massilia sp. S19_KUP03_FR1 TaxID=3025503 RepID=UPI002FCDB02F
MSAIGSDVVSVTGAGSASFANKNVGSSKPVTVTGYTLTGTDAGNYNLLQPAGLTASIAQANLALTGIVALNKTYDANNTATLSGTASAAAYGSDVVNISGTGAAAFNDKNVGASKHVTVTGYTLAGTDAANYAIVQPTGVSANITQATLAVTGLSASGKIYDASNAATLTGSASVSAIGADVVSVTGTGSASFANKNVGTNKAVTVTGYSLSGTDAANYSITQPAGLTASISQANLALTGIAALDKTYDANNSAALAGSASVSAIGSDVVSVTGAGSASFADKNVGSSKPVTVTGYTLTGTDAGNYNLLQPAGLTASIAQANLALTGIVALNKTYDANNTATLSGTASAAAFGSDVVNVSGTGAAAFNDKNVGASKPVTVTGYTLAGTDAANYAIVQPTGLSATISQANLAVTGVSAAGKTYDASTTAMLAGSASVSGFGSDVVSVAGTGSANYADKNVGTSKPVTVTGYTLSGTDAGNYTITQPAGLTASISQANLALTGITALDKTYDAANTATLAGSASVSALGSDVVRVTGAGSASFANKNVGSSKPVTVTGYTLTGTDAGNYNLIQPAGLTASIAQANLALTGLTANSKTYDASVAATLSGTASVATFGSDVVTVAGTGAGAFNDKNVGASKPVTVTGYTLAGADAANYAIVQPTGLSATISQANLAVTGVSAAGKTYDASTTAMLAGSASVSGFGSDVVSVAGTGSANYADKNVGTSKPVTVTGYTLSGTDAGNYTITQPAGLTASISQANLALTGITALDKTYDAANTATLAGSASVSALGSDVVSVTGAGSASFANKNVGSSKPVTVTGYTLTGTDAGNYNLIQPAGLTASIAQANLALTGLTANNKTYDASVAATLSGTAGVAAFGSDVVTVAGTGAGAFNNKNVGASKPVTVTGYTLAGLDAANYAIVAPTGLSATISQANLAVTGVSAAGKTYDASTAATLAGSASVSGFGSDVVSVAGAGSASFADKNVGTSKPVTVTGYTLSGTDAGNYTITQPAGLTASITQANLALTGITALDKVYDANNTATLSGGASVTAIGSDVVNVTGSGAATFANKNVGTSKAVTVTGYTLTGLDAGNYNLVPPAGLTASIAQANLALTGLTANSKTYDASVTATLSGSAAVAALGGDVVNLAGAGSASFADKNVGIAKAVTVGDYTLAGPDAGNYKLVLPAGLSADIARASLAVSGVTAAAKTYDGTATATLGGNASVTGLAGDVVGVTGNGSGTFADKNAGAAKLVTASGFALTGTDAVNYLILQPQNLRADIGKASLAVTGITASNKVYDGSSAATLGGTAAVTPFGADAVTLSGAARATFADKNVGAAKQVQVSGYTLAGTDAANYDVVAPVGLRATITPAPLVVSGISASDKPFDGTTAATVSTAAVNLAGKLGADSLSVVSTGAFSDASAGAGKTVNLSNVYGGADAGNYAIVDQATALASIVALPVVPVVIPEVRAAVAQVQSTVLAPQTSAQPQALILSSTVNEVQSTVLAPQTSAQPQALILSSTANEVGSAPTPAPEEKPAAPARSTLINTRFGAGPGAPLLQIVDGGMQLPALANNSPQ